MEGDDISAFGEPWIGIEKECSFSGVFCDSCDTAANFLCQLNGHVVVVPLSHHQSSHLP